MRSYNMGIAGCGPCGMATAILLQRAGHAVTLFERFEHPAPIGSGLMIQPTGLAVLDRLGLANRIIDRGARIDRLHGMAGPRVVLDVHYSALRGGDRFGIGIHRAELFAALHDLVVGESIPVRTGHTVEGSALHGERRALRFANGSESEAFDLVVDALGTRSKLAPDGGITLKYGALWATLAWPGGDFDRHALSQRYKRSSEMAGVLPVGRDSSGREQAAFFWSLRRDRLDEWRQRGLAAWKHDVLGLWPACSPLIDQIVDTEQLTFATYSHRTLSPSFQPALIHIGDAWHSASPQLGQGANMALLDAWALSRALGQEERVPAAVHAAVASRRRHVRLYQGLTWLFTPVYQSDSHVLPFIRDRLVGPLSKFWPATAIQAAMVSGLIGSSLRALGLAEDLKEQVTPSAAGPPSPLSKPAPWA
ncbi:MAG: FAD-dependent monooxygenase [Pseudomonadota bacterium]|nr:FAD-dependent monooxygenase [Pseudomonadota bacterium]